MFDSGRRVAGKLDLSEFMPICALGRAGGPDGVLHPPGPIRALTSARWIFRRLLDLRDLEFGLCGASLVSQEYRLAGVAYDHPGIVRNP